MGSSSSVHLQSKIGTLVLTYNLLYCSKKLGFRHLLIDSSSSLSNLISKIHFINFIFFLEMFWWMDTKKMHTFCLNSTDEHAHIHVKPFNWHPHQNGYGFAHVLPL
jgi:hypothetical protein